MKKINIMIMAFALIFSSQACKKDEDSDTPEVAVKIGAIAPDFSVADETGTFYKLSDQRGKYVVVDFWAAWCSICRTENPKMQALYTKYMDKNVQFMGVCLDENTENWQSAIEADQLTYLQLIDEDAFSSKVATTYGITSVPFMMLLDTEGKIITFTSRVSEIESWLNQEID
ncbi:MULTISPECIES: peroxiredoxin [unclassified Lentimicrobium]|uniref:peroxiredoxin family protein n=1 Tax=unclassified Lentimicrobium TaxID=2677434 RepID=UPI001551E742|nr:MULTISPECIES: TlpA disulfide reductase family protein [unclassified Lentimicrobium]NPD45910.1 TlpA family protein disulfide reductase [Lentimicrobium sp. S6]NPD86366.1 TlpA family protein disulfide reductase [Lentimicrobium sp. L6]